MPDEPEVTKRITYGDLPSIESCAKLKQISFRTAQKNLSVFRFCEAIKAMQIFVESERIKLVKKYGVESEEDGSTLVVPKRAMYKFFDEFDAVRNMEVKEDIPILGLTEDDFIEENCVYPKDSRNWLCASEIEMFLKF